ncbi:MAG: class I SAM-dependent methyltransferase [Candidatus Binataceae bacterium]
MVSDEHAGSSFAGDPSRTASYFGRLAATYGGGRYYESRRDAVIEALKPELDGAARVLDLGCGNGGYLAELTKIAHLIFVAGADLSSEMIVQSRARLGPAFPLLDADACALPFLGGCFDLVLCSHVLPFAADLKLAVREIAGILRPGGVLASTLGGGSVRHEMRKLMPPAKWADFERIAFNRTLTTTNIERGADRYKTAFAEAALQIETRATSFILVWKDVADWIRRRWFPMLGETERQTAERIMDETLHPLLDDQIEFSETLMLGRKA